MMVIGNKSYASSENDLINSQINWEAFSDNTVLNKDEVYIFKVETSPYYKQIAKDDTQILSGEELNKSLRFIRKTDSERYIAVRHLLRTILSKVCLTAPQDIEFYNSGNKKPSVEGVEFNISHSGNYILLAIAPDAIGVDIEIINADFDYEPVLTISFTPDEILFIKNGSDSVFNFYTLWTRKEAILKASAEGLTDDMDKVKCLDEEVERNQERYDLISFKIKNDYVACLATSNGKDKINYLEYN
jgi:4'-phosphopantetheinyl transferase